MNPHLISILTCCGWLIAAAALADDIVVADFEDATYAPWIATGEAFGPGPAAGTLPNQMHVDGFHGKQLVNTYFRGDDTTGTLTSPEFRIERKYLTFLIGGGRNEQKLALQLLSNGNIVRSATGPNDRAGGTEALARQYWDVSDLAGKTVSIRIVDDAKGGWGHINVDHILQTETKPKGLIQDAERTLTASTRYLNIPIRNGAPKRNVTLLLNGKVVVKNEMELADGAADWWAPMDISQWPGTLTIRVDKLPEDSGALNAIEAADTLKNADDLYREPLRGQFHFSPRRGWNNDPNGMVYFRGEYHLFFQHNPYGWGWGNMHWGHAVSRDMVHWEELGDTLAPDELGPMFSGSAVVDGNNTSGLGSKDHPPLVLIYTAAGNPTVQGIAYSIDGRKFTKYAGNPVLPQISGGNRDPKVLWHEPSGKWVMVLYVEKPAGRHTVHFFTSSNLIEWSFASLIDGDPVGRPYLFECPDFFELPVDGDLAQKRWVLLGANSEYAIGTFDGTTFTPEHSRLPGHRGRGFYAPQTFSDLPVKDGRRIQIGWFQTETRGMPFNQSMTIPLELRLTRTNEGPRVTFTPVKELEALRTKAHRSEIRSLGKGDPNPFANVQAELLELRAEFEPGDATEVQFKVRGATIACDLKQQQIVVNGHRTSAPLRQGRQRLTIYCDRTGLEVFAADGLTYVPMPFQPAADHRSTEVSVTGGTATFVTLELHELRSAWTPKSK
jgi:fructan beta-fructosidase